MSSQPSLRSMHHIHAAPFHSPPPQVRTRVLREIVVEIEPTIESRSQGLTVENHCSDERCRLIPLFLEQFGQSRVSCSQRHRKISNAVRTRQQSCQDSRVRGVGNR